MKRTAWVLAVVVGVAVLVAVVTYDPHARFRGGPRELLMKRPAQLNLERVIDWSLQLDGVEFADREHVIRIGQSLRFTGHLELDLDRLPPGSRPTLHIALRSRDDRPDEEWQMCGWREWNCPTLGLERRVNTEIPVRERFFDPGDYNARVYLLIEDDDAGENSVDLIGTAKVKILPATDNDVSLSSVVPGRFNRPESGVDDNVLTVTDFGGHPLTRRRNIAQGI